MNQVSPLRAGVRRCLAELPAEAIGVVAVSGGPDSVALLHALVLEATGPLVVAHLNHQLRGGESDGDEAFVRVLHARLAASAPRLLPLSCERIDVRAAMGKDNLENAARRLRYDWLAKVARQTGAGWVATGHTADDQAETVLHRLLRGTGLRGLAAIPQQRELAPGIALIRPLLHVRRDDVLAFLQQLGQPFCRDSTNWDRQFTRTRLRHELLPLLAEQYNPAIVDVLGRLAEQACEVRALLESQGASLLASAELPRAGGMVVLDARHLTEQPPILAGEALRLLWEREGWPLGEMGFEDWRRALDAVAGKCQAVDLPGGLRVRRVGNVVQCMRT